MDAQFYEAMSKLDGLTSQFQVAQTKYIILFKLCKDQLKQKRQQPISQDILILRVFNGQLFWMQDINKNLLNQIKEKSEVEGSDQTICEMIFNSIDQNQYDIQHQNNNLKIILQFQLGRGVYVRSELPLGEAIPIVKDEDFLQVNQQFVFDLYDTLTHQNKLITQKFNERQQIQQEELNKQSKQSQKSQDQHQQQVQYAEPLYKHMKAKPKSDMVRPTMKKRKGVGAKLG